MKKVAVLMSTYNGEKYLREQLDSILNQKGCVVDIIVRDDMSTDGTCEILQEYKDGGLLHWYSDGKNLGAAKSFLSLLMMAPESDYYSFADQDDVWNQDKLIRAIKLLDNYSVPALYYANASIVDQNLMDMGSQVYSGEQKMSLLKALSSCNVLGCTVVLNNDLVSIVKSGQIPNRVIMHDYYISALCKVCGGEIIYDNVSCMKYRQHGSNVIGVQTNSSILNKIKSKKDLAFAKRKVSICEQSKELLQYIEYMNDEGIRRTQQVTNYRKSIISRLKLSADLAVLVIQKKAKKHEILNAIKIAIGNA